MIAGRADGFGRSARRLGVLALAASLAACATSRPPGSMSASGRNGTMTPYEVNGVWYRPREEPGYNETGVATWYGAQYHNRRTADGELFDMDRASASHTTLPLPCIVEVTNLDNGRRIRVRVNDRGPFVRGRILDLSREGAKELGFYERGAARVRVRYVGPAPDSGGGRIETAAFVAPAAPPVQQPPVQPPAIQAQPMSTLSTAPTWTAKVQAAAFADRGNAERTAAMFNGPGGASIIPMDRNGARLWRVVVNGAAGETAQALRDRVVAAGFPGAKVVGQAPGA